MSDDQGLTGGIDVFGKGLEVQQPELLRGLETEPIVRHDRVVTLMRMADIVDVTHRPEVRTQWYEQQKHVTGHPARSGG